MNTAKKLFSCLAILTLIFTGCATESGFTERETGALMGSGLGAGLGAIVGSQSGNAGVGTAIGAGAGALAGALAGEASRRQKENTKRELRQEMMQQQYGQQQYAPQPYGTQQTYQPPVQSSVASTGQELHSKYNPRTGQTFGSQFKFDPTTGEELKNLN